MEFALSGHHVTLCEAPAFSETLVGIGSAGSIEATGVISGGAAVHVGQDIGASIAEAEVILVVVPTMHQMTFVDLVAPHLRDGMNLVFMPGSLGSLEAAHRLRTAGITADITISEIAALPYATRIVGPNTVRVSDGAATCRSGRFLHKPPTGYCRSCATCIPESNRCPTFSKPG